jgi:nicotinate-nucleotide adenylyltransferase
MLSLPTPPRRLGLYGGSFDPVHIGHLILAREARELLDLEAVVFLLAQISPHKEERPPVPASLRWDMLRAAIDGEPGFFADDQEILRPPPSFAIDTVRAYLAQFPDTELFYFIGEDNLAQLHTWKDWPELQNLVRWVVLKRTGGAELPPGMIPLQRQIEVSSTEIRNRVARGLSVRYLVPEMALQILQQHQLYAD